MTGAPELIVEISSPSAGYDLGRKRELYREIGVQEYIVWEPAEMRLMWFELRDDEYVPLQPDAAGIIESRIFEGLRLPPAALFAGSHQGLLEASRTR